MWPYYLLAFLSSAGIMSLELAAGRLVAPHLGVNLYTWTSVIGVILLGMSLGAFAGGWVADHRHPRRVLGWALVVAGFATVTILPALPVVVDKAISRDLSPMLGILVPIVLLFTLPAFCLGLVSPILYKLVIADLSRLGGTVGRLSAAGILGSIAGTFATGFWLVPTFGTRSVVLGVAAAMVLLGMVTMPWTRRVRSGAVAALVAALAVTAWQQPAFLRSPCKVESAYFCIRLSWTEAPEGFVKQLVLDNLVHSGADPKKPDFLWYEYEKVMAWVLKSWAPPAAKGIHALVLGGGGYTLPYWIERQFAGSTVEVAEIDPEVTRMALTEFIPADTRIVSYNLDARQAMLWHMQGRKYDVIVGDAFNDVSIPYHLTTREFAETVKAHLAPGGIYMATVIDRPHGPFQGAFSRTLGSVFPHTYVLPGHDGALQGRHGPLVVVSSLEPLPWAEWLPGADLPFTPTVRTPDPGTVILTDDYAPVDNLLLPVFHDRWQRR